MTPSKSNSNSETLRTFVDQLTARDPIGHANLTLVPLWGEGHGQLAYQLASEALRAGTLTITEVDESGSVPELLAVNDGEEMVLLLDGEELVGAKQNRIMNTTVLLPPKSKVKIPVSCVEQGRWRHTSHDFEEGNYSPASLRARKSRDVSESLLCSGVAASDQGAVWDAVQDATMDYEVAAPTMAMSDVIEQRRESFDAYVDALAYPTNACGIIAAIDGKFVAADIFDKSATLKSIWPRLITGYAMDAARRRSKESNPFTTKAATILLEHVSDIPCTACPTVGVGKDWRFEAASIVGQALVANNSSIHLSAFPNDGGQRGRINPSESHIQPPSRRQRQSWRNGDIVY